MSVGSQMKEEKNIANRNYSSHLTSTFHTKIPLCEILTPNINGNSPLAKFLTALYYRRT